MNAFAGMLDSLFADSNMAVDALYTPPDGGPPVPCRAMIRQPDVDWRSGGSAIGTTARIAEIRVSEVAAMEEEGLLAFGGRTASVQKASRPDADRLVWRLELG
ncbi:head-tail joining protein [Azospirillum doebereinerae]|uniref:Uncharacterized protein n=1 Tax=Azospirillum doebereinerae TaxID=92933 RepID=A0A433J4V0_9PROT|nr:hypothetical protein [Azospirillum doebereinerae]RUQ67456.1 hypothetical protein EJ913_19735 [Azospirillum doebereinerae]